MKHITKTKGRNIWLPVLIVLLFISQSFLSQAQIVTSPIYNDISSPSGLSFDDLASDISIFNGNPIFRAGGPPGGGPSDGGDDEYEGDPVITEIGPVADNLYLFLLLALGYSLWGLYEKKRGSLIQVKNKQNYFNI